MNRLGHTVLQRSDRAFIARLTLAVTVVCTCAGVVIGFTAAVYTDPFGRQGEARQQRMASCERGNVAREAITDLARGGLTAVTSRVDYRTDQAVRSSADQFRRIISRNQLVDCEQATNGGD